MKKVLEIALGIVTSVGGFLDVGSLATSAEAGAVFGFDLIWVLVFGTLCVIFLVEMTGRMAAISKHTLASAIRERFGFKFYFIVYVVLMLVDFLTLAAEMGGICIALQLLTGISFRWWALPVALIVWLVLWKGTFGLIENGVAGLGLVTLSFVVAAFVLHPSLGDLAGGLVPGLPNHGIAHYLFVAVSIIGATIAPYLLSFYSSGAVEDKWGEEHLSTNRMVAVLGMIFGSVVALTVLVTSALVLKPAGLKAEDFDQISQTLIKPFGWIGLLLFVASLFIACLGAALEVGLDQAYTTSQAFGWNWSESLKPRREARFALVYTAAIWLASLLMLAGIDPLQLTLFTMALAAAVLPLVIVPLLVITNDRRYMGKHANGRLSNTVVGVVVGLSFVLAVVSIPLEMIGGGSG